ncbi:MAG: glycosyltransferase family 4 protein [Labilithrix sp.]|nr:glycosyltransferase family 4 protein [Labilithrix sp.]
MLQGQLAFMQERGFDVTVISSPGPELERLSARERVETVAVQMARSPDPRDPGSLLRLVRALQAIRPDIVNASTPKAGLLGMIAARALSVPVRIYLLRGLRLETVRGPMRMLLGASERTAAVCAHEVICVSRSLMDAAGAGGHISRRKMRVLGGGSSNGVDSERFRRDDELRMDGRNRLEALGVGRHDPVVLFVGRFARDKGIVDVVSAFAQVREAIPAAKLVVVGGDFADEMIDAKLAERVRRAEGVISTGRIEDVAPYYSAADVLAFPSHREGFPNVPLEAAAAELPTVGYRSTGVVDAVVDGDTGRLVEQGDTEALSRSILAYVRDPSLARAHGRAARERAVREYRREDVYERWLRVYVDHLRSRGLPVPRG